MTSSSNHVAGSHFPARRLGGQAGNSTGQWMQVYQEEQERRFQAVLAPHLTESASQLRSSYVAGTRRPPNSPFGRRGSSAILDGFLMLEVGFVADPVDLCTLDVSRLGLQEVKEEDMMHFVNLVSVKAGENSLELEPFSRLPNLMDLSLPLNSISNVVVEELSFTRLEVLDLSCNNLNAQAIPELGRLPMLRKLDVSGNDLHLLPPAMVHPILQVKNKGTIEEVTTLVQRFSYLEELHLSNNFLSDASTFALLASLQRLERLYLDGNSFRSVPELRLYIPSATSQYITNESGSPGFKQQVLDDAMRAAQSPLLFSPADSPALQSHRLEGNGETNESGPAATGASQRLNLEECEPLVPESVEEAVEQPRAPVELLSGDDIEKVTPVEPLSDNDVENELPTKSATDGEEILREDSAVEVGGGESKSEEAEAGSGPTLNLSHSPTGYGSLKEDPIANQDQTDTAAPGEYNESAVETSLVAEGPDTMEAEKVEADLQGHIPEAAESHIPASSQETPLAEAAGEESPPDTTASIADTAVNEEHHAMQRGASDSGTSPACAAASIEEGEQSSGEGNVNDEPSVPPLEIPLSPQSKTSEPSPGKSPLPERTEGHGSPPLSESLFNGAVQAADDLNVVPVTLDNDMDAQSPVPGPSSSLSASSSISSVPTTAKAENDQTDIHSVPGGELDSPKEDFQFDDLADRPAAVSEIEATPKSDIEPVFPFPNLQFLDISKNKIATQDKLVPVGHWPSLKQVVTCGNPFVVKSRDSSGVLFEELTKKQGIQIQRYGVASRGQPSSRNLAVQQTLKQFVEVDGQDRIPSIPRRPVEERIASERALSIDYDPSPPLPPLLEELESPSISPTTTEIRVPSRPRTYPQGSYKLRDTARPTSPQLPVYLQRGKTGTAIDDLPRRPITIVPGERMFVETSPPPRDACSVLTAATADNVEPDASVSRAQHPRYRFHQQQSRDAKDLSSVFLTQVLEDESFGTYHGDLYPMKEENSMSHLREHGLFQTELPHEVGAMALVPWDTASDICKREASISLERRAMMKQPKVTAHTQKSRLGQKPSKPQQSPPLFIDEASYAVIADAVEDPEFIMPTNAAGCTRTLSTLLECSMPARRLIHASKLAKPKVEAKALPSSKPAPSGGQILSDILRTVRDQPALVEAKLVDRTRPSKITSKEGKKALRRIEKQFERLKQESFEAGAASMKALLSQQQTLGPGIDVPTSHQRNLTPGEASRRRVRRILSAKPGSSGNSTPNLPPITPERKVLGRLPQD